jgi:hypothetical protein
MTCPRAPFQVLEIYSVLTYLVTYRIKYVRCDSLRLGNRLVGERSDVTFGSMSAGYELAR